MRIRFIAKHVPIPRHPQNWRVYDTVSASFPYERADTGKVHQDTTQAEASTEADRLNQEVRP